MWTVGTLTASSMATLQITATVNSGTGGTTIDNTASVSHSDVADHTPGNNSASKAIHVNLADLEVTKSVDNPTPNEGTNVTYTVTVTNHGPDGATGVTIHDALPAGVTYVSDDGAGSYAGGTWTVGSLAFGATATLHITARSMRARARRRSRTPPRSATAMSPTTPPATTAPLRRSRRCSRTSR